jgi:hypothetical protein
MAKKTPIFREILQFAKTDDAQLFAFITTFLLYGKKVYLKDPSFDATALSGWLEVEQRLEQGVKRVPSGLVKVMYYILDGFDAAAFSPAHSGGAVAEGTKRLSDKIRLTQLDPTLDAQIHGPSGPDVDVRFDGFFEPSRKHVPCGRTAKLLFVPKDLKKSRSICMEPAVLQWAQQGVRLLLEDCISTSPISNNVYLNDQGVNNSFAHYGSLTGKVDTIDLSAASDSVHTQLVKELFPPGVREWLLNTRSFSVELPDGRVVNPHKFAPMGSACCFPVQSLIYAAVCLYSCIVWKHGEELLESADMKHLPFLHHTSVASTLTRGDDSRLEPFTVFGDDIITDHRITSYVISLLSHLNFVVNTGKSFQGDVAFRESCGGYYYKGRTVTPTRFTGGEECRDERFLCYVDEELPTFTDHANLLAANGYVHTRKALLAFLLYGDFGLHRDKRSGKNPLLFTEDPDVPCAIIVSRPINDHLRWRCWGDPGKGTHNDLQRIEVRSVDIRPKDVRRLYPRGVIPAEDKRARRQRTRCDTYLYDLWIRVRRDSEGDDSPEELSRVDAQKMGARWRWTPIG